MKKILVLLISTLLIASLCYSTYSKATVYTICTSPTHYTDLTCNVIDDTATAMDTGKDAGIGTADSDQQSEGQSMSIPDRVLNLVDTFAKLVMVI